MSEEKYKVKTNGVTEAIKESAIGKRLPNAHPCNCKNECPYGKDRPFCYPCYAQILAEYRKKKG